MRSRRTLVWAVDAVVVVALAFPAALAMKSRSEFGTFAFWSYPLRIDYCERRYYPSGTVMGTPRGFRAEVTAPARWRTVGHTVTRRAIQAVVISRRISPTCTMDLYIESGRNRYRRYGISGGP